MYWNLNEVIAITVWTLENNSAEYFVLLVVPHSVSKMSWKLGPDDWAGSDETVLILQYVKSLIFESVCLACIVCLVLCHLLPQAISAFPWEGKWYHSCFITFHFFLWEQCRMKAWVAVKRIHVVLSWGESSQIPFVFCFPVHHKELLLKQPGTLLSLRLESNPIWEDLPCYLAERQDSNGIIPYDVLMPASDLDFYFFVFF